MSARIWTHEKIVEEANKYTNRVDFSRLSASAHSAARKSPYGLNYYCAHMEVRNRRWTYDDLVVVAQQYTNKADFARGDVGAYSTALRSGRMAEICAHMTRREDGLPRYVYRIASIDGSTVYIGLSVNFEKRIVAHKKRGMPEVKKLLAGDHVAEVISGPIDEVAAAETEALEVASALASGKTVLNTQKAGGLGCPGAIKWTPDAILKEVAKYPTRKAFSKGSSGAYDAAAKSPLGLEFFFSDLPKKKPPGRPRRSGNQIEARP